MASDKRTNINQNSNNNNDDDGLSYCGSMSGETFSSRRKKNTCTLRQHSIDILAQRLRELPADFEKQKQHESPKRFNSSFHYFRFVVVMFGGFSLGSMLLLRYNVTVAIIKMVNQTALYEREHPDRTYEDFLAEGYSPGGEFDWDNEIQHMIMSWYMIAYTLPQMPCTKLGIMLGSRWAISGSLFICAVSTLLTPMSAYWGWQYVIGLRLINGVGASAVLPMMLNLIEHWMPYEEISLGLTCAQLLQATLTAANPLVAGYLSSIHWSYAFYVPGIVTLFFCVLWFILITDRPDESWVISQQELGLICGCSQDHDHTIHTHNSNNNNSNNNSSEKETHTSGDNYSGTVVTIEDQEPEEPPVWSDVFRVPSFYFYMIMWCFYCSSYSGFTFILPTYLRQFLKIGVSQNGIFCFLIQSGCLLSVIWPHPFLRILQAKFNMSVTASRRVTHAVICFMVAACWIYVGLFHETQLLLLFLNRCFHGSNDIVVTGSIMSNYAKAGLSSIVFSMVNTVGNLSVVFSSTGMGWLLDYTGQSRAGWSYIYVALGVAQLLMLLIFVTLIRSEPIEFKKKNKKKQTISNRSNEKLTSSGGGGEEGYGSADGGPFDGQMMKNRTSINGNNFDKLREANVVAVELPKQQPQRDHESQERQAVQ